MKSSLLSLFLVLWMCLQAVAASVPDTVVGTLRATDIITKGPEVHLRSFMDGKGGRPTLAAWKAAQSTTDLTATIVAADAAAAATKTALVFPPGIKVYSSKITATALEWRGIGPKSLGNELRWKGAANVTTIDWTGSAASGGVHNLRFTYDGNKPATYIDVKGLVDQRWDFNHNHLQGATGHAVKLSAGWINFRSTGCRWDSIDGYCILSVGAVAQNKSSWVVRDFTVDDAYNNGNAPGVFGFDNVEANSDPSVIKIENARIEGISTSWASTGSGIVVLIASVGGTPGQYPIHIADIALPSGTGLANIVYSTTLASTSLPVVTIENCDFPAIPVIGVAGGLWSGAISPIASAGNYSFKSSYGESSFDLMGNSLHFISYDSTKRPLTVKKGTDAAARWLLSPLGTMEWGDGINPVDTNLYRSSAGILKTDNTFEGTFRLISARFLTTPPIYDFGKGGTVMAIGSDYSPYSSGEDSGRIKFNGTGFYDGHLSFKPANRTLYFTGQNVSYDDSHMHLKVNGWIGATVGVNVASASTISTSSGIFHVTGTTQINTINVPVTGFTGSITIIPDGAFTTGTSGNIALGSTAIVNKALIMTYDGSKWYPSY